MRSKSGTGRVIRVVIYARLSKNRNGLSTNTKIQIAECEEELRWYGQEKNATIETVAVFDEDDVSASKFSKKPRPKYDYMLQLIRSNRVDQVWATESERLLRRPEEMNTLVDLAETTDLKELRFTDGDGYNLTTPDGIFNARASAARSERESRKISVRTKRKHADRAGKGLPHGGHRAFGYDKTGLELVPREVAVLREMAAMIIGGRSCRDVCAWLNASGITTAYGKQWHRITVRNTLRRVRYAGIREHLGAPYPAAWPAVFDAPTWDQLQLALKVSRERYPARGPASKYLLTGLAICGACRNRLNGETKRDKPNKPLRRTYQCRHCLKVTRGAVPLEHYVRGEVFAALDTPALGKLLAPADDGVLAKLLDDRAACKARIDDILDDYATGILGRADMVKAKSRATNRLTEIEAQIATETTSHVPLPVGETLDEAWEKSGSNEWRFSFLSAVIAEIIVHPGNTKPFYHIDGTRYRFDPSLVEIVYRT